MNLICRVEHCVCWSNLLFLAEILDLVGCLLSGIAGFLSYVGSHFLSAFDNFAGFFGYSVLTFLDLVGCGILNSLGFGGDAEIGRASCRERV